MLNIIIMHEATCWELVIHSSDLDNNNTVYYQANFRESSYIIASIFADHSLGVVLQAHFISLQ